MSTLLNIPDQHSSPHSPVFRVKLKDAEFVESANVRFELIARANPLPEISFFKDDKPLEEDDRVRVVRENKEVCEILIDHVRPEDAGLYKAIAVNSLGQDITTAKVTVTKNKDVFKGLDDDLSFAECDTPDISLRIDSSLCSSSSPVFKWFKDGHEFEASDRFQCSFDDQEDSIALLFQHVTPEDAGLYTCVASTYSTRISCSAELSVQGDVRRYLSPEPPTIKVSLNDVEVNEGSSAILEAKIVANPKAIIRWYKIGDDNQIEPDERHKFLYEDDESFTLIIKNTIRSDAGNYRIVAINDYGEAESVARLTVNILPKICKSLQDQSTMTDKSLQLNVEIDADCYPHPDAKWFKDGKLLAANQRITMFNEENVYSLIVNPVSLEDGGHYSCTISNICGNQTTESVVQVNASPKFISPLVDTKISEGKSVTFSARIAGKPEPEVEFLKDGIKLIKDQRISMEEDGDYRRLVIRSSREEDAGQYSCVARNEYGRATSDAKLSVLIKPRFEEQLEDSEYNEDEEAIDLNVKVKSIPSPEVHWTFEYSEIESSERRQLISGEDGSYSLRIKEFSEQDAGKYTIVASNSEGASESSAIVKYNRKSESIRSEDTSNVDEYRKTYNREESNLVDDLTIKSLDDEDASKVFSRQSSFLGESEMKVEEEGDSEWIISRQGSQNDDYSLKEVSERSDLIEISKETVIREENNNNILKIKSDVKVDENDAKLNHDSNIQISGDGDGDDESRNKKTPQIGGDGDVDADAKKINGEPEMAGKAPKFDGFLEDKEAKDTDVDVEFEVKLKDGKLRPKIDWLFDGILITPANRRFKIISDDVAGVYKLIIRRPDETTEGYYKCKASNEYGYDEIGASFTIVREPKFMRKLRDKDIDINDKLVLSVKVEAIPEPQLIWYKNDKEIVSDDRILIMDDADSNSLIINQADSSDEGVYKCVAINKLGQDSTQAKVTVLSPPRFGVKLQDMNAFIGDSCKLEVKVSGAERVEWYKDGLKYCDATPEADGETYLLNFTSLKLDDAGEYRCVARNSFGRVDSGFGKLTVKPRDDQIAPKFLLPLQDMQVKSGDDVKFETQISASPAAKVCWMKDGIELSQSEAIIIESDADKNGHTLTIKEVQTCDEGVYACVASNDLGEVQDQASLIVQNFEKPRISGLRDIEAEIDSVAEFSAKITGKPKPSVIWKKDGVQLKANDNLKITVDEEDDTLHHLTIRRVQEPDIGCYLIQANNSVGGEDKSAELTIAIEPPRFTREFCDIDASEGDRVVLEATVLGYPLPEISWFKNDMKMTQTSSQISMTFVDGLCKLIMKNVTIDTSGCYSCRAENDAGRDEIKADINVMKGPVPMERSRSSQNLSDPPKFTRDLESVTVNDGDDVILETKVIGFPAPEIYWLKNGELCDEEDKISSEYYDGICRLIINNISQDLAGVYACKAENDAGDDEISAQVKVEPAKRKTSTPSKTIDADQPPRFTKDFDNVTVKSGDDVVLEAKIDGKPTSIDWFKDGVKLSESRHVSMDYVDGVCKLILKDVTNDLTGIYTCKAKNDAGEDESKSEVTVKSDDEDKLPSKYPEFVEKFADKIVDKGNDLILEAKVVGYPTPSITWLKDDQKIEPSSNVNIEFNDDDGHCKLMIKNFDSNFAGKFVCKAENDLGYDQIDAKISLKEARRKSIKAVEAPKFIDSIDNTTINPGDDLILEAKVKGTSPTITWMKDGIKLQESNNIVMTFDDGICKLVIKNCDSNSAGQFVCKAENESGADKIEAKVDVKKDVRRKSLKTIEPPKFVKKFQDESVNPGNDLILEAKVKGTSPTITWMKDGTKLQESNNIVMTFDDGICKLVIKNCDSNSAGQFVCKAENDAGFDEIAAKISLKDDDSRRKSLKNIEPPKFIESFDDTNIQPGDDLILEAKLIGTEPTVTWYKDGKQLSESYSTLISMDNGLCQLMVKNCSLDSAGVYTCEAINDAGKDAVKGSIVVKKLDTRKKSLRDALEAPKFVKKFTDATAEPGDEIAFIAKVIGHPPPQITWIKDGTILLDSPETAITYEKGVCKLVFNNVSDDSAGKIVCRAENTQGKDEIDANFIVKSSLCEAVKEEPLEFVESLPEKIVSKEGEPIRLQFKLSGPEEHTVNWLKDGKPIKEDDGRHHIQVDDDGKVALIIDDGKPEEGGKYEVLVQTPTQQIVSGSKVIVSPKEIKKVNQDPMFIEGLSPTKGEEGKPLKLEAKLSGYPKPSVSWFKDDELLEPDPHHGFISEPDGTIGLLLDHCTPDDAGTYRVVASNESGEAISSAVIAIGKPELPKSRPTFSCDLKPIDVIEGEPVFLQAKVDGSPPATIKWLKDGDEIQSDDHVKIITLPDGTTSLKIDSAQPSDSGKYAISAVNDLGRNRTSVPVNVSKASKPTIKPGFDQCLQDKTFKNGESGEISVKIRGEPEPEVKWFKDGEEIVPNDRIHVIDKPSNVKSLIIDCVKPDDAGNYSCIIANDAGEDHSSACISVNRSPDFIKKLDRSISAIDGFPVKLEAKAIGEPKPEITWSKDGETIIPDGNRIRIINEPDGTSSLVINNIYPTDKGQYSCTASNPLGSLKTEGDIEIRGKKVSDDDLEPKFIKSLTDVTVNEGDSLKFEGYIDCNSVSEIKWLKNGEILRSGSNIITSFDGERVCLEIRNCEPSDDGEYECIINNHKGKSISSNAFAIIRPRTAPIFTQKLSDVSHSSRLPVSLSCRASGNPEPDYEWYFNGKPIQSGIKYRTRKDGGMAILTILEPKGGDTGCYECKARNCVGMDTTKCNLRISDRSSREEAAHFIKRFNDYECEEGKTAKFTACFAGNPKPEMRWFKDDIEFKPTSKHQIEVESNGIVRLTIKNMEPIDVGHYKLEIENSLGKDSSIAKLTLEEPRYKRREPYDSGRSDITRPGVPAAITEKPHIIRMWDDGLSLGWQPSVSHYQPSSPCTYSVDWTHYPSDDWKTYRSGIRGNRCDIPNLKPSQDYSFRVSAANKYGMSKPSPILTAYRSKLFEASVYKPKEYDIQRAPMDKNVCAPYWLRKEEDEMYVVLREPVTIEFWVYGYPEPEIEWFFNDKKITVGDGKFNVIQDRNGKVCLCINRITEADIGYYTCRAANSEGEIRRSIRLVEAEAPSFIIRLKETTGMAYKSVRMEVKVTGKPMPTMKWFKDWSNLYESDRVKILYEGDDHGTMFINSAITRDSGLYSVTATNLVGKASCSATLKIENDEILYNWANYIPRIVKAKRRDVKDYFDVGDEIERGTQGIVYHAQERKTGESFSAKFMHGKGLMREFMAQELDIMNSLFHPKLLRLYDAFEDKESMCLLTDLCDGGDLIKSILDRATLSESDVANYIAQVLEGLNHMHSRDIAHLGLTIGDILVEHANSDQVKIGDFGLSHRLIPGKPVFLRYGHPEFIAPEIVASKEACLASDMWSIGVITYLLLTGESPFLSNNDRETLEKVKKGEIDFNYLDTFASISNEGKDFLKKLLNLNVNQRMDIKKAINHPWLAADKRNSRTSQLNNIDKLREYRNKWTSWHKNAACKKWYRRNPIETAYTDDSKMIYPPNRDYSPPPTPALDEHDKFKPSQFDVSIAPKSLPDSMDIRSESQYSSGPDTYLLPHRDVDFPLRIREYLRVGARYSPSLANNLRSAHWGDYNPLIGRRSSPQVAVRERRRFVEVMDEEIEDERKGMDTRSVPMRLLREIGTPGYAYGQVYHLKQEAAHNLGLDLSQKAIAPYFREKIKDVIINDSSEVIFTCLPVGQPKPTITWFRNDGIILESLRAKYSTLDCGRVQLIIKPSYAYDAGCYKCVARNDHGVVFCRARLKFGSVSERPETPKVKDVSAREICLCWPAPKCNGNSWITNYALEIQKNDQDTWKTLDDCITQETYLVDNLEPATSYCFRLKAKNKFGWSDASLPSDLITTKTAEIHSRVTLPRTLSIIASMERKGLPQDVDPINQINYEREQQPCEMSKDDPTNILKIGDELFRGRFSLILSAFKKEDASQCVFKVCLSENSSTSGIINEFDIMKSLCHERIVQLIGATSGEQTIGLIMEPLSGMDVITFLSRKYQYTEDTVTRIISQVMDAIEYLHFRAICLLELQPDNVVMIDDRLPDIKLVDFANARHVPAAGCKVLIAGEEEYLAPEILKHDEVSTATDIWCVGILTYILLSGVSPFRGEDKEKTIENVIFVRYHFDDLYPQVTQEAIRFIMLLFKRTQSKRPTFDELFDHKWLLPNEYAVRKRETTSFSSAKLSQFAETMHTSKRQSSSGKLLQMFNISSNI